MEEKIALAPVLVKQEAAHARRVRELQKEIRRRDELLREMNQGLETLVCALSFPGQFDKASLKDTVFEAETLVARAQGVLS